VAAKAEDAWNAYENGDYEAMATALGSAGIEGIGLAYSVSDLAGMAKQMGKEGFINFFKSCFAAGTPLLTPSGHKLVEDFRPGDLLLSAPETHAAGDIEVKRVQAIFKSEARVFNVQVRGRIIRTTAEHPFWVKGKGWKSAENLKVGEELRSHDGRWVALEDAWDSGQVVPVYNCAVEDFHTYFVGDRSWEFSVWAHNSCGEKLSKAEEEELMRQIGMKEVPAPSGKGMQNPAVRAAVEKGDVAHAILQDKMRSKGWLVDRGDTGVLDPQTGKTVYPDAITPQGHPVEIKPRTPSGATVGDSQLATYERATGRTGRVLFYDPNDY
jgi:hypothetical protein